MSTKNVIITFLTKFDKKGLTKAEKELKGLDRTIAVTRKNMSIWAKTALVASVYAIGKFAKSSITAALAQERLDKSLQLTLKSIGKSGLAKETSFFIQQLQSTTNVSENALVPALQQLIAQTGDLEQSQILLKTALDVSAGTGKDLTEVIDAISKAAVGNYKSIAALGVGFSAADAKAMGFVGTMTALQKYTGSAEAATQTFSGQLTALKISAGEATESIGQGFIDAYSIISAGKPLLVDFGKTLENDAIKFSNIMAGLAQTFKEKGFVAAFVENYKAQFEIAIKGSSELEDIGKRARYTEKLTANQREDRLKNTKKSLTYEDVLLEIQKNILANSKKLTKEQIAQKQLADQKAKIESMFDLDKINLQAALTRQLSAEDELRVKTLLKLQEGTAAATDEAQKYLDVLTVIADGKIDNGEIEMLSKKWGMTTTAVLLYLKVLFDSNAELQKMLGLLNQIQTKTIPSSATAVVGLTSSAAAFGFASNAAFREFRAGETNTTTSDFGNTATSGVQAFGFSGFDAYQAFRNAERMADGGIVNSPTFAMIGEQGSEAVIPLDRMGAMGTQLTVNVAGSVISEGQLASVIQDALYNLNRTGAVSQLANLGR